MGNGTAKIGLCFAAATGDISLRRETASFVIEEGFGHSFCYIRPPEEDTVVQKNNDSKTTTFRAISGASVSANNSTPLSTDASFSVASPASATFESSTLFSSTPLQPVPRHSYAGSGPVERGFLSGPFERASAETSVTSSPSSDCSEPKSNPKKKKKQKEKEKQKQKKRSSMISMMKLLFRRDHGIKSDGKKSKVVSPGMTKSPEKERSDTDKNSNNNHNKSMGVTSESSCSNTTDLSSNMSKDSTIREEEEEEELSLQWAQGKAGEDRVHVVISEENGGWVFVGIYDGFNGPDAPEYLMSNLYEAVQSELRGSEVLPAMEAALRRTEEGFLEAADLRVGENPELALMGSCVLVMVMKGEDVYVMNVGDSRAVLARERESGDVEEQVGNVSMSSNLSWVELSTEHSTCSEEEVERIRREHEEDSGAVVNSRVKGYLKVTRAFGAGFLKHPKWNDGLLEMFRIQYVGRKPYLTCEPSLVHYRLGPADRFLILSSDGLYQYFTNQQAVSEVRLFMASFPEGDPAQHLAEELLFRAATKAGMDFHQLLDIPQGERRRYHDDISIIVISFQGRIWRSSL